ncbi:ParB/RepB/Spo0J family partition protein (plasmid) [Flagellatimonas centrodinii]|uniref:ParB/RepB/Spo0J family partition protein n=1 Tax=Flagellatimonas centrodinii TaxID=2806210 RepID=UPI001FFC809A|nr:ParB/RepB/Spo0J family partition protein [Flagellatimonas centrodinii]ULQ48417.1 ParB/RepB/Spo0J family partition protein [Flagellatimonas centrodinii]
MNRRLEAISSAVSAAADTDILRKKVGEDLSLREVDPAKTRMNPMHRRSPAGLTSAALEGLCDEITRNGQQMPALGYWLEQPDGEVEIELIYGSRRRAACLALGIPLKVRLVARATDEEVARIMFSENNERSNYSFLEQAREFQASLEHLGLAKEQGKVVAARLGRTEATVSRMRRTLRLPRPVLALFDSCPQELSVRLATDLAAIAEDKDAAEQMAAAAGRIAAEDVQPDEAVQRLRISLGLASEARGGGTGKSRNEAVRDDESKKSTVPKRRTLYSGGRKVGMIAGGEAGEVVTIRLGAGAPAELIQALEKALEGYLTP